MGHPIDDDLTHGDDVDYDDEDYCDLVSGVDNNDDDDEVDE